MSISIGQRLGSYEITALLGEGGMGTVYRATDTRLNRAVAIKVSASQFSERFAQEASVIASLNHPHICQLYDVGPNYLVMELVDGTPLRGPLPLKQAVEYAGQMLEALDAAHRKGITHRDIKPANVLVTKQGVKLLDFGLAKRRGPLEESDATLTAALTGKGEILGTLQYMSPEQLQGKDVDARSDLFSFGCLLYEMVTGKRAFEGQSAASVIAAILEREPVPLEAAHPLDRVLRRCLAKDPDHRFQNALDLKTALTWALEQSSIPAEPRSRRWWIVAAVAVLVLGALGTWQLSLLRNPLADQHVFRFQFQPPEGGRFVLAGAFGGGFAVSPDSQTTAFVANVDSSIGIWVRSLDATQAHLLPGTNGAINPFWSPDNKSIAFSAGGKLRAFDLLHGTLSNLCDTPGAFLGGAWSADGRIVFASRESGGLFQVAESGGAASQFTTPDRAHGEVTHSWPQMLPGGRFLYSERSIDSENETVYAATVRDPLRRIRLLSSARGLSGASYVRGNDAKDYLFWFRGTTLLGQQFDADKLQLTGDSFSVADPAAEVSVSSRVLVYAPSPPSRQFQWFDRAGRQVGVLGETGEYVFSRISPDGLHVVAVRVGPGDIWLLETARGIASRLTSRGIHLSPVWSPDGRTILFSTGTPFNLFRIPAEGSGGEERVLESENRQQPTDWSKNGRMILFNETSPDTGTDLWTLEMNPDGKPKPGAKPQPYIRAPFNQTLGRFSPDMRWVAYQSDDSGRSEVYVDSFPEAHKKVQISTAGGRYPEWRKDGQELFYVSLEDKLMAVTMKPGPDSTEPSLPHELFALPRDTVGLSPFDVAADGQRFLMSVTADKVEPLTVIVNWSSLLRKGAVAP
jgi:serine/threonine protein kinase